MKILNESNINRIMSHMKDKDIAMLTAFRTDPKIGLSKKQNRKRNKNLENKLSSMGYRGFTKIVGYYNETPEDKDSVAVAEESYIILNTGSSFEDFVTDMTLLSKDFNQQSIVIWSHTNQKAYLLDNQGNILQTFADFSIDTVSKGWSDIKGHNLTFIEESVDIRFGFTDKFNENGNWMTAMGYDAAKNKYRKEDNNMNEDLIKELNNIPESDEVDTAVPVTLAAAKEDDKENVESVKKSFKDLDKLTAEFIKQNDNRENKVKGTEAMDKMELMESLFEDYDEEEDIDASEDILDMFDFLYKLFSPTAPSGESTIKLPIKNKQKGFRGSGGDEGHDELNTTDYDISVNTDGDLVLKADSKDKFDWVEEACDYLDIKHELVKENKVTKSKHNFEKIVQVPTDDNGNPMKISEYFEEIGDDVTKYMKPSPALKKQLKTKNEDCKKTVKRTRMNEAKSSAKFNKGDKLVAKKNIYYGDADDINLDSYKFGEKDIKEYKKLGFINSDNDFEFPKNSKFTVLQVSEDGDYLIAELDKTGDKFEFVFDDEPIDNLFTAITNESRTRMNEALDLEENTELVAAQNIYYSDVSDLWFDKEDFNKYRELGILRSSGDVIFPKGSKFTVKSTNGPSGWLELVLNKTGDEFDFAIDDEDIDDLFIRVR